MSHHCHAIDCETDVPPAMQMCKRHWGMVPKFRQRAVWNSYRKGQEVDKRPSAQYLYAAAAAVKAVALAEGVDRVRIDAEVAEYHRAAEAVARRRRPGA